jgi:hypothetical protein
VSALDILMALLAAIGLLALLWLPVSALMDLGKVSLPPRVELLPVSGSAQGLEAQVRALVTGKNAPTLVLVDCGLDDTGALMARCLCRRWSGVQLCTPGELKELFSPMEDATQT